MTSRREPQVLTEPGAPPPIEEQPQQPDDGQVVYAVTSGTDVFDSGIEGLDPITIAGTAVPADKADELKASAKHNDITIRKVG
jgi:hypothetical protein